MVHDSVDFVIVLEICPKSDSIGLVGVHYFIEVVVIVRICPDSVSIKHIAVHDSVEVVGLVQNLPNYKTKQYKFKSEVMCSGECIYYKAS